MTRNVSSREGLPPNFVGKVIKDLGTINEPKRSYRDYDYIKIVFLWSLLEAWIDTQTNFNKVREKVNWLRSTDNPFTVYYPKLLKSRFDPLINVANANNIKIPSLLGKSLYSPKNDPSDLIEILFQIRCKVAHGNWQLDYSSSPEQSIINIAYPIYEKWVHLANLEGVFS